MLPHCGTRGGSEREVGDEALGDTVERDMKVFEIQGTGKIAAARGHEKGEIGGPRARRAGGVGGMIDFMITAAAARRRRGDVQNLLSDRLAWNFPTPCHPAVLQVPENQRVLAGWSVTK